MVNNNDFVTRVNPYVYVYACTKAINMVKTDTKNRRIFAKHPAYNCCDIGVRSLNKSCQTIGGVFSCNYDDELLMANENSEFILS